jgi:hypothetical protein
MIIIIIKDQILGNGVKLFVLQLTSHFNVKDLT